MDSRSDDSINAKKKVSFEFYDPTAIENEVDDRPLSPAPTPAPQEVKPALCELSGSMFLPINPRPLPIKQQPKSTYANFQLLKGGIVTSFHSIFQVLKPKSVATTAAPTMAELAAAPTTAKLAAATIATSETMPATATPATFFYKQNPDNSPFMPELEAFCWGCYHFLIPNYVPQSTHAIYDYNSKLRENVYTGVSSKAIPNFKSTKEVQLKDSDLILTILNEGVTIEELEELDLATPNDSDFDNTDDTDLHKMLETKSGAWVRISKGDMKRFRKMKGQALGLMASYLFEEDDDHKGNTSCNGVRIDFDGSFWPILSKFKSSNYFDSYYRALNAEFNFDVHAQDIRDFPHLKHAKPYYWPTTSMSWRLMAAKLTFRPSTSSSASSSNPWNAEENKTYQNLAKNPVFNYFKFQTLLKFMLSGADVYLHIAEMHIRPEATHQGKPLIDMLYQHIRDRVQRIKDVVIAMPEFAQFIAEHGEPVFKRITAEIETRNKHYEAKSEKIDGILRSLDKNKPDDIEAYAKKLNIPFHSTNNDVNYIKNIKDQIMSILTAKKESYQRQIIELKDITVKYNDIVQKITAQSQDKQAASPVVENDSIHSFLAGLQTSMQAETSVASKPMFRSS